MSEPNPKLLEMYERLYQQELEFEAMLRKERRAERRRRANENLQRIRDRWLS